MVVVALLGGAFMTGNYYLLAGKTLPWLDPGDPFDEGLSMDGLLTLIALALIPAQIAPMRARAPEHTGSVGIAGAPPDAADQLRAPAEPGHQPRALGTSRRPPVSAPQGRAATHARSD